MLGLFTSHPESVGETYGQHARFAAGTGLALIGAGLACLVHGLLPFLFTTTGSRTICRLYQAIAAHKARSAVLARHVQSGGGAPTLTPGT